MDIITKAVNYLNPGLDPIIAGDELLYEISKQIQWSIPEYDEQPLVVVLAGLHTDMDALHCIANGSG